MADQYALNTNTYMHDRIQEPPREIVKSAEYEKLLAISLCTDLLEIGFLRRIRVIPKQLEDALYSYLVHDAVTIIFDYAEEAYSPEYARLCLGRIHANDPIARWRVCYLTAISCVNANSIIETGFSLDYVVKLGHMHPYPGHDKSHNIMTDRNGASTACLDCIYLMNEPMAFIYTSKCIEIFLPVKYYPQNSKEKLKAFEKGVLKIFMLFISGKHELAKDIPDMPGYQNLCSDITKKEMDSLVSMRGAHKVFKGIFFSTVDDVTPRKSKCHVYRLTIN